MIRHEAVDKLVKVWLDECGGVEGIMQTIAVISRKGGAGKSTVAVNIAVAAQARGRRVLLADLDPQKSSSEALRLRPRMSPAVFEANAGKLFQLRQVCDRQNFDLMIIDTPPAPEHDVLEAVRNADFCLLVARPSFLDLAAVAHSGEMVRRLNRPFATVLNQAPGLREGAETPTVRKAVEALRFAGLRPAPVGLRARSTYQSAMAAGLSVEEYRPGSPGAQEIERLWDFLAEQLEPTRPVNHNGLSPVAAQATAQVLQALQA
jgi:chromosome partitioning protein